jgi:hypothetical protein
MKNKINKERRRSMNATKSGKYGGYDRTITFSDFQIASQARTYMMDYYDEVDKHN